MPEQTFINENGTEVLGYQLRPGDTFGFEQWSGASSSNRLASGGYALFKTDGNFLGTIQLGDFLIKKANGQLLIEEADGFYQRYKEPTPEEEPQPLDG